MKIAVVDYRAGNLTSVKNALEWIGANAFVTSLPAEIDGADRIIIPGVGHFASTTCLQESGMAQAIRESTARGVPLLGICLGMQWLFASSSEAPGVTGLSLFTGVCERFPASVKSPHVGWNQLLPRSGSSALLKDVPAGSYVYFSHSYRVPVTEETCATSEYGGSFTSAVERDRVFGVQFHPEKSGAAGLRILENFCNLPC